MIVSSNQSRNHRRRWQLSGLLAAETRKWDGIELKFIEPAEARMPDKKWRLYEFKGDEQTQVLPLPTRRWFLPPPFCCPSPPRAPAIRRRSALHLTSARAGTPLASLVVLSFRTRPAPPQVPRLRYLLTPIAFPVFIGQSPVVFAVLFVGPSPVVLTVLFIGPSPVVSTALFIGPSPVVYRNATQSGMPQMACNNRHATTATSAASTRRSGFGFFV